ASPLVRMNTISTRNPGFAASRATRTRSACARARALPRVPRRSPGTSTALLLRVVVVRGVRVAAQTEKAASRLDVEGLRAVGLVATQRRDRHVQDLVHERDAQAFDRLTVFRIELPQSGECALELALPQRLQLGAQGHDRGHDVETREPAPEGVDLGLDDGLRLGRRRGPRATVVGDDAFQIVDVVEVDAV